MRKNIEAFTDDAELIKGVLEKAQKESLHFVSRMSEITKQIRVIMERKQVSQKDLAERMKKEQPEISRMLSGTHNMTMRTLAHIETILGENVIQTEVGRVLEMRKKYNQFAHDKSDVSVPPHTLTSKIDISLYIRSESASGDWTLIANEENIKEEKFITG